MAQYTTVAGDMVDLICWREYGDEGGYAEAVLDANPGLADHGPFLPAGVVINLPDIAPVSEAPAPVTLWD